MKGPDSIGLAEEPEEPDEPDKSGQNAQLMKRREALNWKEIKDIVDLWQQAVTATKGKLGIYNRSGDRAILGKTADDFVQDGFVAYMGKKGATEIDITDAEVLKEIYNSVRDALRKVLTSRELRLEKHVPAETVEDQHPSESSRLSEEEIRRVRTKMFDKFISGLSLEKKRAMKAITRGDIEQMMRQVLSPPPCRKILRYLVGHQYLDADHFQQNMSLNLQRPAQLRKKLPEEYRILSSEIFHILKNDRMAKNRYLARKLDISYRKAKELYNDLRNDLLDFLTKELKNTNGVLSGFSDDEKIEVLTTLSKKMSNEESRAKKKNCKN